jgi:threonine dehydrogenase-like Zn-dependent dehydrogenase
VIDPAHDSPYTAVDRGHLTTMPEVVELAMSTVEKLRRLPIAWQHVWRGIDALGIKPKHPVVFECVGVPGVLDAIIAAAPLFSRVVVVGVCMGQDTIRPAMAINKEIDLRFVLGYTPLEFRDTLYALAEGKLNAGPLVTGQVGLDGVAAAFEALGNPEVHAKILVDPRSSAGQPG